MNRESALIALLAVGFVAALGTIDRALDRINAEFRAAFERLGTHQAPPRAMPRWLKLSLIALWVAFVVWCCNPSEAVAKQGHDQQAGAERSHANFDGLIIRAGAANFNSADKHDGKGQRPQKGREQADANSLKARREFERTGGNAGESEQRQPAEKAIPFHSPASPETLGESI